MGPLLPSLYLSLTLTFALLLCRVSVSCALSSPASSSASAPLQRHKKEVHAFYYLWYGNPATDGQFKHWNHEVLPHWTPAVNRQHSEVGLYYNPEQHNLHSPFYPALGAYSSMDPDVIRQHFRDLKRAGVSTVSVSWWGQAHKEGSTDNQGVSTDRAVALLLSLADETNGAVSVCFHLEPYPGRSAASVLEDLEYIHERYGHHQSLARRQQDRRVIFYVYDSYHIPPKDWAEIFTDSGRHSIRPGGENAHLDSFMLGLWLDAGNGEDLVEAGFDGFYTYFAADGFSFGSTSRNWKRMCAFARQHALACTLSVGPGYQDDKIRPWNQANTRARKEGEYYDSMWLRAVEAGAEIVSVTSFNEWGEGTQIEPVEQYPPIPSQVIESVVTDEQLSGKNVVDMDRKPMPRKYLTYELLGTNGYLDRTAQWAARLNNENPSGG